MTTTLRHTLITAALTGSLALSGITGCVPQDQPPDLPPLSSMSADLTAPASAPAEAQNADPTTLGDYQNFANAWLRVKILQLYGTGIVLVPAAVMAVALTQKPVTRDDAYAWSVTALGATADLEVRANLVDGWDVDLLISNEELDRFLWVDGEFALDSSNGVWQMHDPAIADGDDAVLALRWAVESETDRSLSFENTDPRSPDVGDVLTYSVLGDTATVVFEDASDPSLVANITWDTTTAAGSIEVPGFNNGERACWDEAFVNAPCE